MSSANDTRKASGTEFICKLKYLNNLPEVPVDAKLLTLPLAPSRYVPYRMTSLERHHTYELPFHPKDLLELDLVDWSKYKTFNESQQEREDMNALEPHPSDQVLIDAVPVISSDINAMVHRVVELGLDSKSKPIAGHNSTSYANASSEVERVNESEVTIQGKPSQPNRPLVTWLRKPGVVSKGSRATGHTMLLNSSNSDGLATSLVKPITLERAIDAIDQSFEGSKEMIENISTFTHPSNPSLSVERCIPLYPDGCCWGRKFTLLAFDSDPLEGKCEDNNDRIRMGQCLIQLDASDPKEKKMHFYGPVTEKDSLEMPDLGENQTIKILHRTCSYTTKRFEGSDTKFYRLIIGKRKASYTQLFAKTVLRKKLTTSAVNFLDKEKSKSERQDISAAPLLIVTRRPLDDQEKSFKDRGMANIPTDGPVVEHQH
jgi:hypothetical protein